MIGGNHHAQPMLCCRALPCSWLDAQQPMPLQPQQGGRRTLQILTCFCRLYSGYAIVVYWFATVAVRIMPQQSTSQDIRANCRSCRRPRPSKTAATNRFKNCIGRRKFLFELLMLAFHGFPFTLRSPACFYLTFSTDPSFNKSKTSVKIQDGNRSPSVGRGATPREGRLGIDACSKKTGGHCRAPAASAASRTNCRTHHQNVIRLLAVAQDGQSWHQPKVCR